MLENEQLIDKAEYEKLKSENEALKRKLKKKDIRLNSIIKMNDKIFKNIFNKNSNMKKDIHRFDRILQQSDRQGKTILVKKEEQEKLLMTQAKMASMGRMIDAIAHQWKSPLSIINLHVQNLQLQNSVGNLDAKEIEESCSKISIQIDHADNTINEFRSFFRENNNIEPVFLSDILESTFFLLKDELIQYQIVHEIICDKNYEIKINQNEFKHILINLIQNSKDAFLQNSITKRKIFAKAYNQDEKILLEISDNAGGIPEDIIENIFKANFTTKKEGKGTGIGLHLSKQIIEKYSLDISVENHDTGVSFFIDITPVLEK